MLSTFRPRLRPVDQSGFTLVELLVSMFILVTGVAVAYSAMMTTTVKATGHAQALATLQTQVRAAVDTLASDLRQATCLDTTTTPVSTATGSQVTFYSPDRATPYHLRQVSYRVSGGTLQRAFATSTNTGGPPWTIPALGSWSTILDQVSSTSPFTYEDASGAPTTVASNVASATVTLLVRPPVGAGGGASTYQTTIALRTATCDTGD
jgi:prepilin-type N-terminal cleavage/methylation domain-containing protein